MSQCWRSAADGDRPRSGKILAAREDSDEQQYKDRKANPLRLGVGRARQSPARRFSSNTSGARAHAPYLPVSNTALN
jgi:hypothetical protein